MSRWIRVQTSIFGHEVFAAEPFSEREAWLWLISKAAWKDTVHRVGAAVLPVPTGSLFVTVREMQSAWKWTSTRRVHQFLELLSSQNMIETRTETGKTHVTVCNYSKYQNAETHSETPTPTEPKQVRNTKDTSIPDTSIKSSLRSDVCPDREKPAPGSSPTAVDQVVTAFSEMARQSGLSVPRAVTASRRRSLLLRIEEHGLPAVLDAIDRIGRSRFCRGENDRGWRADLDFLCQPKSFVSILEGKYDDRPSQQSQAPPRESDFARHQRECREAVQRKLNGNGHDEFASPGPAFDLEPGDYRAH